MEGDPDGAREVHLPAMREDHPATGTVPRHPSRPGRRQPVGDDPYAKFGEHQPLNRQSESYAREGIDLDVSTLADWVGACTATLAQLVELIRRHVFAAERIHGDDTTVPVLAKGKTITGRVWTYVRDDRPSRDRGRQQRCSSTRAIATANTPHVTSPDMPASCRPMPMPGSLSSTRPGAVPRRSP